MAERLSLKGYDLSEALGKKSEEKIEGKKEVGKRRKCERCKYDEPKYSADEAPDRKWKYKHELEKLERQHIWPEPEHVAQRVC